MTHKLAIVIPYFGPWPAWINFFIESCRPNSAVQWFLIGDSAAPENRSPNVRHVNIGFDDYKDLLSQALGIPICATDPYKLCDLRPALPFVHRELLAGYDFVGFGDLDVIYGDLGSFYDEDTLAAHDLLSTHPDRISGHLCLMRNDERMITAFRLIPRWARLFSSEDHAGTDEREFYNVFRGRKAKIAGWIGRKQPKCLFREAYSTPGAADRMRWYWKDGRLTNESYPQHPFMYLHFMSWHSNRWYADQPGVAANAQAPWSALREIASIDWRDARQKGFMISPQGIGPIEPAHYP